MQILEGNLKNARICRPNLSQNYQKMHKNNLKQAKKNGRKFETFMPTHIQKPNFVGSFEATQNKKDSNSFLYTYLCLETKQTTEKTRNFRKNRTLFVLPFFFPSSKQTYNMKFFLGNSELSEKAQFPRKLQNFPSL